MSRSARLTFFLLALILSLPFFLKGRVHRNTGGAAFLVATGRGVLVRLGGDFPRPGVYRFATGVTVASVTKMTVGPSIRTRTSGTTREIPLTSGDILTLSLQGAQQGVLSVEKMGAKERILFGIPLEPDAMSACDWAALPGIGAALSERIVADRHKNGAFGSLQGVLRVPGIGPGKLARIKKYF